jgi:hypothetical protein
MDEEAASTAAEDLIVLDRHRGDFESVAWVARRFLTEVADRGFAKWVLAPERGRFLIFSPIKGFSVEQMFVFVDDVDQLISAMREKAPEIEKALGRTPNLGVFVTADVHERLLEMLRATGRAPAGH